VTLAWELERVIFRFRSFHRDLSFGIIRFGNLCLGGWGKQLADTWGTGVGGLVCHVLKELSKNPSM
jgi:hypothetical protein